MLRQHTGTTFDPTIRQVATALPRHRYEQSELVEALERRWAEQHYNQSRLRRLHDAVRVGGRNLALPLERYDELEDFGAKNDAFIEVGTELGAQAIADALEASGLEVTDIDAVFFTTVTGLATPTIDARIANRLGFRSDVKRIPMFGLGCVGGAAGIARMSEYLRAFPEDVAVLLSVELCSLTIQPEDLSVTNLIATGLFGDGAAAVVGIGARRALTSNTARPHVEATQSVFYRDTEWVMGWNIASSGFQVVLSAKLPALIRERLRDDVDAFLAEHDLTRAALDCYVAHPGGPAVLEAMQDALEVAPSTFEITWRSLEDVGNLSSASVLFVLKETLERHRDAATGDVGLLLAMGPGFCAELVLLRW